MSAAQPIRIEHLGESALLLHFGEHIDAGCNARVHSAAAALRSVNLTGVVDIVPAYASLLLRFDALIWQHDVSLAKVLSVIDATPSGAVEIGTLHEIPVCYGGVHGPDLDDLAAHAMLTTAATIAIHCSREYRVAMLGFAPGFAYLLGLDAALHMPRRAVPRTRVPAGSVAIGGAQTGIYPLQLPGGWQWIGRTPCTVLDMQRDMPALLAPGDRVRFRAIDETEFDTLKAAQE
jgi:KipI family sensor histidine kinase inhibitor